jgi:hypothetical protein
MFYGYVCNKPYQFNVIIDNDIPIYVVTKGHDSPEVAQNEMKEKIKRKMSTPNGRNWFIANCYGSKGVFKSDEQIIIPDGYWGVAA